MDRLRSVSADMVGVRPLSTTASRERATIDPMSFASGTNTDIDIQRAATLLTAVQRGRAEALTPLLAMVEPYIRRRARRVVRDEHLVDDVVQEVWILLARRASCIRDPKALIAWLGVVTLRRAIRLRDTNGRLVATHLGDEEAATGSTEDDAVARCSAATIRAGVGGALASLDAGQRTLIERLTFDDRPRYADISREIGRPVGSLGPSRQRVLDKLRRDPRIVALQDFARAS